MFSLFAPYNCILIHDLNAESLREPAFQQLMDLLKTISGVTVLIFQITRIRCQRWQTQRFWKK